MITKDNFAEFIQTIEPEILTEEIEKEHGYILMEAHIFNAGGFATVESMDYNEEIEAEAQANGNLFCSKEDFIRLIEETQATEY